ncbi:MAG: 16S rRNA processing protein RimM [Actinobacteria bacterium]|nr:16S rRNA processing protein RimM [Actinomycetota bacterium]
MSFKNVDARVIGIIRKPHGISGELSVEVFTDYPSTIKKGDILFLDKKCKNKIKIGKIRIKKNKGSSRLIFKFECIDSIDTAEELRNKFIYRHPKDSPILKVNEYWIDDIINCNVYCNQNTLLGKVIKIEKNSANDNLVIEIKNLKIKNVGKSSNILFVPIIKDYIKKIDLKNKRIILEKIPEYI